MPTDSITHINKDIEERQSLEQQYQTAEKVRQSSLILAWPFLPIRQE